MVKQQLPYPDQASLQHSERVLEYIKQHIHNHPAKQIPFSEYMNLALYAPQLGYYNVGNAKLGAEGDYITAPELSSLFSRCLARQCAQVLAQFDKQGCIIEFGAGQGVMAADLLLELEQLEQLPQYFYIVEISPDLRQQQQQTLQRRCPQLIERIQWLQRLPQSPIKGVILANEVLDAMPIHCFQLQNQKIFEYYITMDKDAQLQWHLDQPYSNRLKQALQIIQTHYLTDIEQYSSEICLWYQPWLNTLHDMLKQGLVLLLDYGFPSHEYYHPQRDHGTLMCHFRHHAHENPLIYPGIQDITAHVDFTRLAYCAHAAEFHVAGYIDQANFLINCGITELLQRVTNTGEQVNHTTAVKRLTLPSEMGELFKVLALSRKIESPLIGFQQRDRRHQLTQ